MNESTNTEKHKITDIELDEKLKGQMKYLREQIKTAQSAHNAVHFR